MMLNKILGEILAWALLLGALLLAATVIVFIGKVFVFVWRIQV